MILQARSTIGCMTLQQLVEVAQIEVLTDARIKAAADSSVGLVGGTHVQRVAATALDHWDHILLVEDDTARSARRGKPGVELRSDEVIVRLHRIGKTGLYVVDERVLRVGVGALNERAELALAMIDDRSPKGAVVVAGTTYGTNGSFLTGLGERGLDAIVEVRPSTEVTRGRRCDLASHRAVRDLLEGAKWERSVVPVAGSEDLCVSYSVARLGRVSLGCEQSGTLCAIETGGINGVHPGTLFGLVRAQTRPSSRALVGAMGWTRWIRPLVRKLERQAIEALASSASHTNGNGRAQGIVLNGHVPEEALVRFRANIKLSKRHDQEREDHVESEPDLRGALAPGGGAVNVVELFAGAGGMGLGFLLAETGRSHCRIIFSGEVDPIYVNTLNQNHDAARLLGFGNRLAEEKIEPVDLRDPQSLRTVGAAAEDAGGVGILIGGPPCQGFSNSNRNSWHAANPNNRLVDVYLDYVKALLPRVFVMENVQGIFWTDKEGELSQPSSSVLEHVREQTAAAGYQVFVRLLDSVWYGVPQYRSRFFVVGLHRDLGYGHDDFSTWGPFPRPSHGPGTRAEHVTVRDAIGDLPALGNGESFAGPYYEPDEDALASNEFLSRLRGGVSPGALTDHITSRHADYVIDRYRRIPEGGNWESIRDLLTNYSDVERTHSNIYRRLTWNEPAVTIGHYRKSMLVHPDQHRGLSLREAARLQSFPDWFRFAGSANGGGGGLVHKQQQLANAVSPLVALAIAEFLLRM